MNCAYTCVHTDIAIFPECTLEPSRDSLTVFGDLHANALKFLHLLIQNGFITNLHPSQYTTLYKIYQKEVSQLTQADIDTWLSIVSKMKCSNRHKLLLLGDELGDRGNNDFFMITLIEKISHMHSLSITLSNHADAFLASYESGFNILNGGYEQTRPSTVSRSNQFSQSTLAYLQEKGFVTKEELKAFTKSVYLPKLTLIEYHYDPVDKTISLFTHAPIGLSIISKMASELNIHYKDETPEALIGTIDAINQSVQALLQAGAFRTKFYTTHPTADAFINNRNYPRLVRPEKHHLYQLRFIHGHDDGDPKEACNHIYSLDDQFGKVWSRTKGTYKKLTFESTRPQMVVTAHSRSEGTIRMTQKRQGFFSSHECPPKAVRKRARRSTNALSNLQSNPPARMNC